MKTCPRQPARPLRKPAPLADFAGVLLYDAGMDEIRIETYLSLPEAAQSLRQQVFMREQGFTQEFDEDDSRALHLVAWCGQEAAGTCRILEQDGEFHLQRLAVLPEYRKQGIAARLVKEAESRIREAGGSLVRLHAQVQAQPFYEKQGYVACSEPDDEDEGVPHVWMVHVLAPETERITEQPNPASCRLSSMTTLEAVQLMNREDAAVLEAIADKAPEIAALIDRITASLAAGGRLFYAGAGTSGRLGVLDAVECPPTFGVSYDRVVGLVAGGLSAFGIPDETAEDSEEAGAAALAAYDPKPEDFVLGIAASGRTPYVMGALLRAREAGASTGALVCTQQSPFSALTEVVSLVCGPEVLTGSTRLKAGTACKMVLNMISTIAFTKLGCVWRNFMVDMKPDNEKLQERAARMLQQITGCSPDQAEALLVPGRSVKTAAVMYALDTDEEQARWLLEQAGGRLDEVLESADAG